MKKMSTGRAGWLKGQWHGMESEENKKGEENIHEDKYWAKSGPAIHRRKYLNGQEVLFQNYSISLAIREI